LSSTDNTIVDEEHGASNDRGKGHNRRVDSWFVKIELVLQVVFELVLQVVGRIDTEEITDTIFIAIEVKTPGMETVGVH
jgi:hypothetical protein